MPDYPYQFEHAISFINGIGVTQWATFMILGATQTRFFLGVPVTSISTHASSPTITTAVAHGLAIGDKVAFFRVRSVSPDMNELSGTTLYTATSAPTAITFIVSENVLTAGAGGWVGRVMPGFQATEQISSIRVGDKEDRRLRDNTFY